MTGELGDASKVDPLNAINITYEDLSKEQRQKFEADLKRQNEEIKAKMLACYGKTRQGVIEKEKFVMPGTQSATLHAPSTTTSTSPTTDVSTPKDSLVQFLREFVDKFEKSQTVTQNLLFDMHDKMEKGKSVDTSYSTKDLAQSSAAPATNVNVQYGMPLNYFAGQSPPPGAVRPTTAEPVRPIASTGQTDRIDRSDYCLGSRCGQTGPSDWSDQCYGAGLGAHSRTCANFKFGCFWPN